MYHKRRVGISTSECLKKCRDLPVFAIHPMKYWYHEIKISILPKKSIKLCGKIEYFTGVSCDIDPVFHIRSATECDFSLSRDPSCEYGDMHSVYSMEVSV